MSQNRCVLEKNDQKKSRDYCSHINQVRGAVSLYRSAQETGENVIAIGAKLRQETVLPDGKKKGLISLIPLLLEKEINCIDHG